MYLNSETLIQFKQYLIQKGLKERCIQTYLHDLRRFCDWYQKDILQVTHSELKIFWQYLMNTTQQTIAVVNRRIQTLGVFFHWAIKQGLMTGENPIIHLSDRTPRDDLTSAIQ